MIVPALMFLGQLSLRRSIGTNLMIITAKSALGFAQYERQLLSHNLSADFGTVFAFVLLGILGSIVGRSMNVRMKHQVFQRSFAIFLVVLGGFVIVNEGVKLFAQSS